MKNIFVTLRTHNMNFPNQNAYFGQHVNEVLISRETCTKYFTILDHFWHTITGGPPTGGPPTDGSPTGGKPTSTKTRNLDMT